MYIVVVLLILEFLTTLLCMFLEWESFQVMSALPCLHIIPFVNWCTQASATDNRAAIRMNRLSTYRAAVIACQKHEHGRDFAGLRGPPKW